jgi:NADH:ubiquinone oxidoreductase subunit 6 (subunit J)
MTGTDVFFWLVATATAASALMVVVTQNIVRAAIWLLFTLAGTAALYFLLGADFVGATQLIVYVGGTLVLVVFGVMLTAQGPFVSLRAGAGEWAMVTIVGLVFFGVLAATATFTVWPTQPPPVLDAATSPGSVQLGQALLGIPEATPADRPLTGLPPGHDSQRRTQVAYLLPFEIVSVHLLVVLIGAAYLARAKRRREVPA